MSEKGVDPNKFNPQSRRIIDEDDVYGEGTEPLPSPSEPTARKYSGVKSKKQIPFNGDAAPPKGKAIMKKKP